MSALSRALGVSLSALTQIADRLERARLVKRVAEENDRRVRCLQLTPRGETMMRKRRKERVLRAFAVLQRLSPPQRELVRTSLEILVNACSAPVLSAENGSGESGDATATGDSRSSNHHPHASPGKPPRAKTTLHHSGTPAGNGSHLKAIP